MAEETKKPKYRYHGKLKSNYLNPALLFAIKNNDVAMVGQLVDIGAEINEKTHSTYPIIEAAERGHISIVRLLLEKGADLSVSRDRFVGPGGALLAACINGRDRIVQLLLDHGENINDTSFHQTLLHLACRKANTKMVRLLLEKKADARIRDETGRTALEVARELPDDKPEKEEILEIFQRLEPELYFSTFCTANLSPGGM